MEPRKKVVKELMTFASELAVGAGRILKDGFNRSLTIEYKGRINPVTQYDMKAEKYITSRIAGRYPYHSILAEEGSDTHRRSPYRWVIDPLDGTVNYAHGFPVYCVSVAVCLLYTSPSPRDRTRSRMPSSA